MHQELIASLEELLVKQFRTLQSLVNITRREREVLIKSDADALIILVEEKDSLLSQMESLEASRRIVTIDLAKVFQIDPQSTKVKEILPFIDSDAAERIERLIEGIYTLYDENRELNLGNQALAQNTLKWLDHAQAFLLSFYSTPETYDNKGRKPSGTSMRIQEIEKKA